MTPPFPSQSPSQADSLFPAMPPCLRIMVVELMPAISRRLHETLRWDQHRVDQVSDGVVARERAREGAYDVVVLALPARDGVALCRILYQDGSGTPVLMLQESGAVEDVVAGLNAGAADYLVVPLDLAELAARLRALARRHRLNLRRAARRGGGSGRWYRCPGHSLP